MSDRKTIETAELSAEDTQRLAAMGIPIPLVRAGEERYAIPKRLDLDAVVNDFPVYEDDIWVVTPPKCGTTWTQEILWLMLNDVEKPTTEQFYRIPFLELGSVKPPLGSKYPGKGMEKSAANLDAAQEHSVQYCLDLERPRRIKSHLPLSLLPRELVSRAKVIFVCRNLKDMCVSYYYHFQMMGLDCDFKTFARAFKDGGVLSTPVVPMIREALDAARGAHADNVLFLTYEEMKADLRGVLGRMQRFLGVSLSEDKLRALETAVTLKAFKSNPLVNKEQSEFQCGRFIRKGIVGDWETHFDQELNAEWDPWLEEQLKGVEGFDMKFKEEGTGSAF